MKKTLLLLVFLFVCLAAAGCGSNLVVNSTGDEPDTNGQDGLCKTINNDCTLRAAITEANSQPGVNKITFDIGSAFIYPDTLLPPLETDNTHIDGEGIVNIDCGNISKPDYGLQIFHSNYNIIQGMRIRNCTIGIQIWGSGWGAGTGDSRQNTIGLLANESGDYSQANVLILNKYGISIMGSHAFNNKISGNFIGIHQDGQTLKPNENDGVLIQAGAHDNLIGSLTGNTVLEGGNLISGNPGSGIYIYQESSNNQISGNIIGTNLTGNSPRQNDIGIEIADSSIDNVIGISQTGEGQGNLISGNNDGIIIENSNGTTIAGNLIGTNLSGENSLPNNINGIHLVSSKYSIIGTNGDGLADELEGNLISGNSHYGILITSSDSQNNVIAGNKIGTDISGSNPLGNGSVGSGKSGLETEGHYTRIGTDGNGVSDDLEGNLISANGYTGISLFSNGNRISGNVIGLDSAGTTALGNAYDGIYIDSDSGQNLIGTNGDGTSDILERNLISGNCTGGGSCYGIEIDGGYSIFAGNYIGPDITGTIALSPNQIGILTSSTSNLNFFGTNGDGYGDDLEGNLISGNGFSALIFSGFNNIAAGNIIGTDSTGTSSVANGYNNPSLVGVVYLGGTDSYLGTNGDGISDQLESNLISGNSGTGVVTTGQNNVIAGNKIGTDISGTNPLGNAGYGISIPSEFPTDIYTILIGTNGDGLSDQVEANIIAANAGIGISVNASNIEIAGNFIGTDTSGSVDLGNGEIGILLRDGTTDHIVGGSSNKANLIAFNQLNGISFNSSTSGSALITYNSIYSNQALGIGLNSTTNAQPNDPGDIDTGPNDLMNFPVLTEANSIGLSLAIDGDMVNSLPYTSYLVQFFDNESCDPSGHGEGKTYVGSKQVFTDVSGNATFSAIYPFAATPGHFITSTATAYGKTSEFSACIEVTADENTYSGELEENPCDRFNQDEMDLVTFNYRPGSGLFSLYVKNPEPYPIDGPMGLWQFTAVLGDSPSVLTSFFDFDDRAYFDFVIPENYLNTKQTLKVFSNYCFPPFFVDEVTIFTNDPGDPTAPSDPSEPGEAGSCHEDLGPRSCPAAGGTYIESTNKCICR